MLASKLIITAGIGALVFVAVKAFGATELVKVTGASDPGLGATRTVSVKDDFGAPERVYSVLRMGGGNYTVTRLHAFGDTTPPSIFTFNQATGPIASAGPELLQLQKDMNRFPADLFKE